MHYRRGVDTIHDMIHQKLLRAQSLIESQGSPNFESLEDTYKDMINYCSFAVAFLRGKMEGQDLSRDAFNKKKFITVRPNQKMYYSVPEPTRPFTDEEISAVREATAGGDLVERTAKLLNTLPEASTAPMLGSDPLDGTELTANEEVEKLLDDIIADEVPGDAIMAAQAARVVKQQAKQTAVHVPLGAHWQPVDLPEPVKKDPIAILGFADRLDKDRSKEDDEKIAVWVNGPDGRLVIRMIDKDQPVVGPTPPNLIQLAAEAIKKEVFLTGERIVPHSPELVMRNGELVPKQPHPRPKYYPPVSAHRQANASLEETAAKIMALNEDSTNSEERRAEG